MTVNKLILGDNLEILKTLEADSVDLIYLDPPFFSNRNYEVIWGDAGEVRSFQDRWSGGIDHYIAWLKERVTEMHRVLKPTGSMFLHCDWHANAYIRVDILDRIFGANNFKNEIIWDYEGWVHKKMSHFPNKHDTIFFYSKSDKNIYIPLSESWTKEEYVAKRKQKIHSDENGREYIFDKRGNAGQRRYLDVALAEGQPVTDVWSIGVLTSSSKERIGYPTQKPEALLERIIKCASNEGDIVLDPFMGGGTTIAVADRLNRQWLGIDQSAMAVKVTELRLQKQIDGAYKQTVLKRREAECGTK
jgi:DNA modification methylase